ncbi:MAG: MFS transporter, partial [Steroidobacteraceae bacterium]|nr:MFS transporter [Steroidobacteraceae bacterium]MDW8259254.1 MFS transporter [Gammaproteobacteria bacterium]
WSLMTALAGTAKSYAQLFLYRVGVGVGEATLSPSAYSLLASYFPPQRLSLAVGIFSAGVTGGTGLAFLLGGALIAWVYELGDVNVPLFGTYSGWRAVMVLVGLLGLPVALLMFLVREPPRPHGFARAHVREVWRHGRERAADYGYVFVGYGATAITAYSVMAWTPALYTRQYGATIPQAAATLGMVALVGGLLGAVSGGLFADRLMRRGVAHAQLLALSLCGWGLLLPGVVAPLMPTLLGHAAVIFFTFFFGTAATGPAGAYVQSITPENMRAQFGALYQLSLTLVGATLGPFLVGFFTDALFGSEQALRYSLALVAALANPLAAWLLWRGWQRARDQSKT